MTRLIEGTPVKLHHRLGRVTRALVDRVQFLDELQATEGSKYLVRLRVGHGRVSGSYFVKEGGYLNQPVYPESNPENVWHKYHILASLGLPVVPMLRLISFDHDAFTRMLLMSCVVDQRHILVDKHGVFTMEGIHVPLESMYLSLADSHDQLRAQFREIAERAFNQGSGVLLSPDAFSLLYDIENETFSPLLLDIGYGSLYPPHLTTVPRRDSYSLSRLWRSFDDAFYDPYPPSIRYLSFGADEV